LARVTFFAGARSRLALRQAPLSRRKLAAIPARRTQGRGKVAETLSAVEDEQLRAALPAGASIKRN